MLVGVYLIKNWDKRFETSETRKLKRLNWLPIDNQHDNRTFRRISAHAKQTDIFTAWVLMLQIASRMPTRGRLEDESGALGPEDMSLITGFPQSIFDEALRFFSDPSIGWIVLEQTLESAEPPEQNSGLVGGLPGVSVESAGTSGEYPGNKDLASKIGDPLESAGIPADSPGEPGKSAERIEQTRTDRQGIEENRNYDNSVYMQACEELSSLSFFKKTFEEKEIWVDTIQFFKSNKRLHEAVAKIYTESQKNAAKAKKKEFDEVRYLRQVKRGLFGEIEWDIEPTLTFVQDIVEKKVKSLSDWIEKIESEDRKAREEAAKAEKEKVALAIYEQLPEEEKNDLWKTAQDIESRTEMAKLGFKAGKNRINERIVRLMDEQGYLNNEENLISSNPQIRKPS